MSVLDDIALIQHFVAARLTLAANRNLRIETAFDSLQLTSPRYGLLASRKLSSSVSSIKVRREIPYWELLSHILAEHGFIGMGSDQSGLVLFEHHPIPTGYEMRYTPAKTIWKAWRDSQERRKKAQWNLMVFVKTAWCPVSEMVCSCGHVYITTLSDELVLQMDDRLVWLSQLDPTADQEDDTVFFAPHGAVPTVSSQSVQTDVQAATVVIPAYSGAIAISEECTIGLGEDVATVVRCRQGRFYISTPIGEISIEGKDIHFFPPSQ